MITKHSVFSARCRTRLLGVLTCTLGASLACAQDTNPARLPEPEQMDYFKAIQISKAGAGIVLNLDLPRPFLERPAARALRFALRNKFRHVSPDPAPTSLAPAPIPSWTKVLDSSLPPSTVDLWQSWKNTVPLQRGFKAPIFSGGDTYAADRTLSSPIGASSEAYRDGQAFVAEHIARDGLVGTTMALTVKIKRPWLAADTLDLAELKWCGIPTDLLEYFTIEGQPAPAYIATWIKKGSPIEAIPMAARGAVFAFQPASPGFELIPADAAEKPGAVRLQLPGDSPFTRVGDGGAIDVARALAAELPDAQFVISAEQQSLKRLEGSLGAAFAGVSRTAPVLLAGTPLPVSPWAQDNAVVGRITGSGRVVSIVPRFASINEQSSQFVPGDSLVFETLGGTAAPLGPVYQSRLLFQGGNLLVFTDPESKKRTLVVGEAEIYRNRALGLSGEQAATALAVEMGAQRVHVLPAVSFHLDMEFTLRKVGDSLVACANDEKAASLIMARCGADAMLKAGVMTADHRARIVKAMETGDAAEMPVAVSLMWDVIGANTDSDGYLGEKIKKIITGVDTGWGQGAVERLMLALDQIDSIYLPEDKYHERSPDEWFVRYMRSLKTRSAEREDMLKEIGTKLGMKVIRIASTSEDNLSTSAINGVHTKDAYLMPAYGGVFAPLDDAAMKSIRSAFGDIRVVPIMTARIQEKHGGLHCMTGLYPAAK